jgi:thymidylate synthase
VKFNPPEPRGDYFGTDHKYQNLLHLTLHEGEALRTRNSNVKRIIAVQYHFNSTPLVGLRKTAWKNALREWEWFMSGSNKVDDLHPAVRHWWEPWKGTDGRVKYNYSNQMRDFWGMDRELYPDGPFSVDQVSSLVNGLKNHPNSRRLLLTTWNAAEMSSADCPITNCHNTVTQAFVTQGNRLRLVTYQRSVDLVCGLPHNWIQMAAFHLWLCHQTGLLVDGLTWIGGDCHLYEVHEPLVRKMLDLDPSPDPEPVLCYEPSGDEFRADDFYLDGEYKPLLTDKAEMVV